MQTFGACELDARFRPHPAQGFARVPHRMILPVDGVHESLCRGDWALVDAGQPEGSPVPTSRGHGARDPCSREHGGGLARRHALRLGSIERGARIGGNLFADSLEG
jgi:hypothetical protein